MIKEVENIATVINAFHDGGIIFKKEESGNLIWKIDCEYLAKKINPNFSLFWIKINKYQSIEFNPWLIPTELPEEIWKSPKEIFKTELEILSAEIEKGKIKIICNQADSDFNFNGGELLLECKSIELFDQEWNRLEYLELKEIVNQYWDNLKQKNKIHSKGKN